MPKRKKPGQPEKSDRDLFLEAVSGIGSKPAHTPSPGNTPLSGLKDALGKRTPNPAQSAHKPEQKPAHKHAPAPKKPDDDPEIVAFLDAMSDVRERPEFRGLKQPKGRKPSPRPRAIDPEPPPARALHEALSVRRPVRIAETSEYIEWSGPSAPKDLPWRLHRGEFSVRDYLDLHGYTADEAHAALVGFIERSRSLGYQCVKVIHGRGLKSPGGPVLKEAMRRWLEGPLSKYVLAYATARPEDGGLGATYILLKG